MTASAQRIYNFSAGPAVLPLPVLEQAQRDLVTLPNVGMSILEISHRSKTFEDLLNEAIRDIHALAGIPSNYRILMLQGGATLQFSMVPMNLLGPNAVADYIDTGSWADKALKEAKKVGKTNVAASTKADGYSRIPRQDELRRRLTLRAGHDIAGRVDAEHRHADLARRRRAAIADAALDERLAAVGAAGPLRRTYVERDRRRCRCTPVVMDDARRRRGLGRARAPRRRGGRGRRGHAHGVGAGAGGPRARPRAHVPSRGALPLAGARLGDRRPRPGGLAARLAAVRVAPDRS